VPLRLGGQTAGMSVMDAKLGEHGPLARFIAQCRTPGPGWLSYDETAAALTALTGVPVTGMGVSLWADRLGIPDTIRKAKPADRAAYLATVDKYLRAPRGERTA
jgi:hypothetical protein